MSEKIFSYMAAIIICSLLLTAGCTQTADMTLKFALQDSTTYKVITQVQDIATIEGDLSKETIAKGGSNNYKVEMTFTQQIQQVDDKNNAVAKITINELKCFSVH